MNNHRDAEHSPREHLRCHQHVRPIKPKALGLLQCMARKRLYPGSGAHCAWRPEPQSFAALLAPAFRRPRGMNRAQRNRSAVEITEGKSPGRAPAPSGAHSRCASFAKSLPAGSKRLPRQFRQFRQIRQPSGARQTAEGSPKGERGGASQIAPPTGSARSFRQSRQIRQITRQQVPRGPFRQSRQIRQIARQQVPRGPFRQSRQIRQPSGARQTVRQRPDSPKGERGGASQIARQQVPRGPFRHSRQIRQIARQQVHIRSSQHLPLRILSVSSVVQPSSPISPNPLPCLHFNLS
jgi:hypothetical protein